MRVKLKIDGMKELQKSFKKLGKMPQKIVTPAAKKGMTIAYKQAKENAPYETGNLQRGIKLVGERSKSSGKKIYRIVFDRNMNEVFQKKNKDGEIVGYYPVSMEYGYFTTSGRYIPGYRFIHNALDENEVSIAKKMVDEVKNGVDKELGKVGLKS